MADPLSVTIGLGVLTNLLSHPLCKVIDSEPVKRLCHLDGDRARRRNFAEAFARVRDRLPAERQRYIDFLNNDGLLRHDEGFELHKLFGGAEAPDTVRLAAVFRRLWPELPANIDFILAGFIRDLEGELRKYPDFAPWIAYREVAETRADVRDIKARLANPPRPAPPPTPFTVPAPVADFTGREDELAQLESALTRGGRAAISAVAGLGGVGKSQLAYEICRRLADRFPDGQLFLDMRGTAAHPLAPEQAMARVVEVLAPGARPPADLERTRAAYLSALRGRQALLLLDNARDQAQVERMVPPSPCAMLVTSRARIVLPGARRIDLDSLPGPKAVALLREILVEERPLAEADLTTLAERCARLPLALRVAGSFLLKHPATPIAAYLKDLAAARLRRLDEVEAVLRLSVEALERERPELAGLWRQLAVFPAGFRPDAAGAVWQVSEDKAGQALDELYGRSLVQYERTVERFRLHDLLRDLAAEDLDEATCEEAAARHAAHYVDVLGQCDDLYLQAGRHLEGLAFFDAERVNIEAAQAWAGSRLEESTEAVTLAARLSGTGAYILHLRLTAQARAEWLEVAVEGCRKSGSRSAECDAVGNLGNAWVDLGDVPNAIACYEKQLVITRELGDRRGEGTALGNLGIVWDRLGETHKAIKHYEQSLVVARELGNRLGESNALNNLGAIWSDLGKTRKAIECCNQALDIYKELGYRLGEKIALTSLGIAWARRSDAHKAAGFFERCLAITREIGDRRGEVAALGNLGAAWARIGQAPKAVGYHEQQLAIAREIGDRWGEGSALGNLGLALADVGETRRAVGYNEQALAVLRELGDRRGEGNVLGNLGIAWARLRDERKAIGYYKEQLAITREIGDRWGEGNALFNAALAYDQLGKPDRAVANAREALTLFRAIESPLAPTTETWLRDRGVEP